MKKLLKKNLNEIYVKAFKAIKNINPDEKVIILYHDDMDGACSATIIIHHLRKLGINPVYQVSYIEDARSFLDNVSNYTTIIILDMEISHFDILDKLDKKVIIIDHHPPHRKLKNALHINPRFLDENIYYKSKYYGSRSNNLRARSIDTALSP